MITQNKIVNDQDLTLADKLIVFGLFLDWLTYENIFFLEPEIYFGKIFLLLVYSFKLIFPFFFLVYAGFPKKESLSKARIGVYLIFFSFFIIWGLLPTLVSGIFVSWIKLLPVFVLFLATISFFEKKPKAFNIYAKCLILYVLISLFQYCLVYIFKTFDPIGEQILVGPYGLFGNVAGRRYIPSFEYPIIRLTGFWKEPSNASGSAYASFFLGLYLIKEGASKRWKYFTILCFVAGLLTLSNAGYLAIGTAFLFRYLLKFNMKERTKFLTSMFVFFLVGVLVWLSLFSRSYFANQGTEYELLLAMTGSTSNVSENYDPSAGRFELMEYALESTSRNLIGAGIQPTDANGLRAPANAPLFWFVMTGFLGLFFLIMMQITVFVSMKSIIKRSPNMLYIILAFIVVMMQQLIYGSWMDANFIILTAVVLVGIKINHDSSPKQVLINKS